MNLVINLRAVKALDLDIPRNLPTRANEMIAWVRRVSPLAFFQSLLPSEVRFGEPIRDERRRHSRAVLTLIG